MGSRRPSWASTNTAFSPWKVQGPTKGEYFILRSAPKADMTPHRRSAQSLGRNFLPSRVRPTMMNVVDSGVVIVLLCVCGRCDLVCRHSSRSTLRIHNYGSLYGAVFPNATVAGKKWPKSKIAAFGEFVQQLLVVMRAGAGNVVPEDVAIQRGAFGNGDVFRNHRIEHVIAIALAQFVAYVVTHPSPAVEAGEQVAAFDAALEYGFENFSR